MKIYRADLSCNCEIVEMELKNETASFITTIDRGGWERRQSKESSYHKFFNTFNEAKEWLMSNIDLKISDHHRRIDQLKSEKQKINNL